MLLFVSSAWADSVGPDEALQIAEQVLRTKMQDRDEQQAAIERILKEL